MDYKNRVPGSRYRNRRQPLNLWIWVAVAAIAAVALVYGLWPAGDEVEPAHQSVEPTPAGITSQQLAVPPIGPSLTPTGKPTPPPRTAAELLKPAEGAGSGAPASGSKKPTSLEPMPTPEPTPAPVEPRFTFYKILPEKEVIIPETEIKAIKRDEDQGHATKPQQYLIQVGSYSTPAEAEKVRTRLSQLKVKSKIEAVKIENTQWYRVKIGPFDKLVDVDKVRDYLKANQLPSVVQKSTGK